MKLGFDILSIEGFDWDKGNSEKNRIKHKVRKEECEEVFFNKPFRIFDDQVYSKTEKRFGALGRTDKGRLLAVIFTVRSRMIRVISARDQGHRDRRAYALIGQEHRLS